MSGKERHVLDGLCPQNAHEIVRPPNRPQPRGVGRDGKMIAIGGSWPGIELWQTNDLGEPSE
jgi:hypothetical protein